MGNSFHVIAEAHGMYRTICTALAEEDADSTPCLTRIFVPELFALSLFPKIPWQVRIILASRTSTVGSFIFTSNGEPATLPDILVENLCLLFEPVNSTINGQFDQSL